MCFTIITPNGWEFLCIAEDPSEVYYTNIPQPGAHCVLKYKSLNMAMWVKKAVVQPISKTAGCVDDCLKYGFYFYMDERQASWRFFDCLN